MSLLHRFAHPDVLKTADAINEAQAKHDDREWLGIGALEARLKQLEAARDADWRFLRETNQRLDDINITLRLLLEHLKLELRTVPAIPATPERRELVRVLKS